MEKLAINILFEEDLAAAKKHFEEFFLLLGEKLIAILVKLYAQQENLPQEKMIQKLISEHHTLNAFKLDINLQQELTPNIIRLIDLLQLIKSEDTLPLLGEITFHENTILAQRALKLIAIRGSDIALSILLKTLKPPQLQIQIAAIEYLGSYRFKQVREALVPIAQGTTSVDLDELASIDLRMSALKSLLLLDEGITKTLLAELLTKKRLLFFHLEPKALRNFAKEQLRKLAKK